MANTYSQLYIHFVITVKRRECLIQPEWEQELYQYITGIVQKKGHKMIAINGMPDHLHIFIGYLPREAMSDLIKVIKCESTNWINEKDLLQNQFSWQAGYGAFSYSRSHVERVYHYVMNQKQHHLKKTFRQEYIELLEKYDVDYDERYIFDPVM